MTGHELIAALQEHPELLDEPVLVYSDAYFECSVLVIAQKVAVDTGTIVHGQSNLVITGEL